MATGPESVPVPTNFIPTQVRSIYDPNSVCAHRDDQLLEFLFDNRAVYISIPHVGHIKENKLLAAELAHFDLLDNREPRTYEWLGLSREEVFPIEAGVHAYANNVATSVTQAIVAFRNGRGPIPGETDPEWGIGDPDRVRANNVLLGGAFLSAAAHERGLWIEYDAFGQVTYEDHTKHTAAALQTSWELQVGIDGLEEALHIFRGRVHDTLDDRITKEAFSFLAPEGTVVTPLVIRTFLSKLGVTAELAEEVAGDHLALTRMAGLGGKQSESDFNTQVTRRNGAIPTRLACLRLRHAYLTRIQHQMNRTLGAGAPDDALGSHEEEDLFYEQQLERAIRYPHSEAELQSKFGSREEDVDPPLNRFANGIYPLTQESIQATLENSWHYAYSFPELAGEFLRHYLKFMHARDI